MPDRKKESDSRTVSVIAERFGAGRLWGTGGGKLLARIFLKVQVNCLEKGGAKLLLFAFTHTADPAELGGAGGVITRHLAKSHVREDDISRNCAVIRKAFAEYAQFLEKIFVTLNLAGSAPCGFGSGGGTGERDGCS